MIAHNRLDSSAGVEACGATHGRLVEPSPSTGPEIPWNRASCRTYRSIASKLKALGLVPMLSICSYYAYSEPASVESIGEVLRLRGPVQPLPEVRVDITASAGGGCSGAKTKDLVLQFGAQMGDWAQAFEGLSLAKNAKELAPCAKSQRPLPGGSTELRLFYRADLFKNSNESFRTLVFVTSKNVIVDHWIEGSQKTASSKNAKPSRRAGTRSSNSSNTIRMNPLLGDITRKIDVFDDAGSWDAVLGAGTSAVDLNSPELDRFRSNVSEKSSGLDPNPIELQQLKLPYLDLPLVSAVIRFSPENLELETPFELSDLDAQVIAGEKNVEAANAVLSLNLIRQLTLNQEWSKAQRAIQVFESSNVRQWVPQKSARYWAIRGKVMLELSRVTQNALLFNRAMDLWREGLRSTAGSGPVHASSVEYMLLEMLRELELAKSWYAAASVLVWAKKYSLSPRVEERLEFYRGEVLFHLGLYDEADREFRAFFEKRKNLPLSAFIDRRLVPASAFRLGDIQFEQRQMKEAEEEYSAALQAMPSVSRFTFEGLVLPEESKMFPHVFFNRAEAYVRTGREAMALRDLRAFIHISPTHTRLSLALFRIGEIQQKSQAEQKLVLGAWRECVFRASESLGGRLCQLRLAGVDMIDADVQALPRFVGMAEQALPRGDRDFWSPLRAIDLEVYVNLVLADAYIQRKEPMQAFFRLEKFWNANPSPVLRLWLREYLQTALLGIYRSRMEAGRYKEVIEDYESRRKNILVQATKPELLWMVARAYLSLSAPKLAAEVLKSERELRKTMNRNIERPFDPSSRERQILEAELAVQNLENQNGTLQAANSAVSLLAEAWPETQELRIRIGEHTKNAKLKLDAWQKLSGLRPLRWNETLRWSRELRDAKNPMLSDVLERGVGAWLMDLGKKKIPEGVERPPAILVLMLAEVRTQRGDHSGAILVLRYLESLKDDDLGGGVERAMLVYRQGLSYQAMGLLTEARQSFDRVVAGFSGSLWARLSQASAASLPR